MSAASCTSIPNDADLELARTSAALMRSLGCDRRSISPDEAVALEPALASVRDRIVGADYCAEDESGDAHAYTVQLAERCRQRGVRVSIQYDGHARAG